MPATLVDDYVDYFRLKLLLTPEIANFILIVILLNIEDYNSKSVEMRPAGLLKIRPRITILYKYIEF